MPSKLRGKLCSWISPLKDVWVRDINVLIVGI